MFLFAQYNMNLNHDDNLDTEDDLYNYNRIMVNRKKTTICYF